MAQTSWPFDNADTTEEQYSEIFKRLVNTGVWGDNTDNDLKPFGDSSGMQVKVPLGYAFVRGFLYKSTATETLAVVAAEANPRIDVVVLRLDPAANSIVLAVKKGTAAASPSAPSLTQTDTGIYELPLGRVAVAASASTISAGNVTDQRAFTGKQFGKWTTASRPSSPDRGDAGFNLSLNIPEFYDGSWKPFQATTITASMITDQQNIDAGKVNGKRITSSNSGAPSGPAVGDMWVDWS